jgi:hypothetical protein
MTRREHAPGELNASKSDGLSCRGTSSPSGIMGSVGDHASRAGDGSESRSYHIYCSLDGSTREHVLDLTTSSSDMVGT